MKKILSLILSILTITSLVSCTSGGGPSGGGSSGGGSNNEPNTPTIPDDSKLHVTDSFEFNFFLDREYTKPYNPDLQVIVPNKSLYVKCKIITTNKDDKDYTFNYFVDISNVQGFELTKVDNNKNNSVTVEPNPSLSGIPGILISGLTFTQKGKTEKQVHEFEFIFRGEEIDENSKNQILTSFWNCSQKFSESESVGLSKFDYMLRIDNNRVKSIVAAPSFIINDNSIELILNENMRSDNVEVYSIFDGRKDFEVALPDHDNNKKFIIDKVNEHTSIEITIRSDLIYEQDYTKKLFLTKLAKPFLNYNDNKLSFDISKNATHYYLSYQLENGDWNEIRLSPTENVIDINSIVTDGGLYTFRLSSHKEQSINSDYSGLVYFASDYSNLVNIRKLKAPELHKESTSRKLTWNKIMYADKYDIYVNEKYYTSTTNNYFKIDSSFDKKKIEIKAISNDSNILDSNFSEHYMVDQA